MSISIKHFDDTGAEKALKDCPKLVRTYVKKLKESNKHWQKLCGMAVNKLKNASKNNCDLPVVSVSVADVRQAFADYYKSEGCSCCRDTDNHDKAENKLAELLAPDKYDDGSGFDWYKYATER